MLRKNNVLKHCWLDFFFFFPIYCVAVLVDGVAEMMTSTLPESEKMQYTYMKPRPLVSLTMNP